MKRGPGTTLWIVVFTGTWGSGTLASPPMYRVALLEQDGLAYTAPWKVNGDGLTTGTTWSADGSFSGSRAFVGQRDGHLAIIEIPGAARSDAATINDHGVVAGLYSVGLNYNSPKRFFRYTPAGGYEDLGGLGGNWGEVVDLNNRGEIIGSMTDPQSGNTRAVRFSDESGWVILSALPGHSTGAVDINERGEVIGFDYPEFNTYRAWYWYNGVKTELPNFGGSTHAYYINNRGEVIGHTQLSGGAWRAYRWTPGDGMTYLPLLDGATESKSYWVNDQGLIGGTQQVGAELRPFLYDPQAGLIDLGVDIGALDWRAPIAMNVSGEMVLTTFDADAYNITPYVYSPEYGLQELTSRIVGEWPIEFDEPTSINACGEIAIRGFYLEDSGQFGQSVSALLTPVRQGDLDGDSDVDLADYAVLQAHLLTASGAAASDGDLDADGDIDADDAAVLISVMRTPCR